MAIFVPLSPVPVPPSPPTPDAAPGGFTLLELATVLMVVGVALSVALPSVRRHGDRAAARAAREAVVGMVAVARAEAMAAGGAALRVDPGGDRVWVEAGGEIVRLVVVGGEYGVDLGPEGTPAELRFDALGLGRTASRTLTVRRGEAAYSLTVSAYGRVRRW